MTPEMHIQEYMKSIPHKFESRQDWADCCKWCGLIYYDKIHSTRFELINNK